MWQLINIRIFLGENKKRIKIKCIRKPLLIINIMQIMFQIIKISLFVYIGRF